MKTSTTLLTFVGIVVLATAGTYGCAARSAFNRLPIEGEMIATRLTPETRLAVVTESSSQNSVPSWGLGDPLSKSIADVSQEKLRVEAVPVDHGTQGDWAEELKRSAADGENTRHSRFLSERGFDGYVKVVLDSDTEAFDNFETFFERNRIAVRVGLINSDGGIDSVLSESNAGVVACDLTASAQEKERFIVSGGFAMKTIRYVSPKGCATQIAKLYDKALTSRLDAYVGRSK